MIKGFAGTAIELMDFNPEALNLSAFLEQQSQLDRKNLSVDAILDDIDFPHLTNVAIGQFLQALITFVPVLKKYQHHIDDFYEHRIRKHQINPTRRTNIFPLATNSADEVTAQGLKEGIMDFALTQMGITEETLRHCLMVLSGDGKTFDMLLQTRWLLSPHESLYESWRFIIALLELWHTKWTDLNRTIRCLYGKEYPHDPSTLSCLANAAHCPTPSDLKKVDLNDDSHLLDLSLDAHMLVTWE